jgi:two-component system chemotaxis sensor kinase CheA
LSRGRALAAGGATLLAVSALTWLWGGAANVLEADHGRYESALPQLRHLDRTLNQDVLRCRDQLLNTYDPLVATRGRIRAAEGELAVPPVFLAEADRVRLAAVVATYTHAADEKQKLVERFKSGNAVLENSRRYLPTLAGQVADAADRERPGSGLGAEIHTLLNHVLVYDLTSDESLAPSNAAEAEQLRSRRGELSGETAHQLDLFVNHAQTILRTKREVDGLVRDILAAPVVAGEEAVEHTYRAAYERAEARAQRFAAALYAACVALAGLVGFAFHRLRRALAALRQANATLEQKVEERTASLDRRNGAIRLVLDNVDQGLVTADRTGRLAEERSPALDRWVSPAGVGPQPFLWDWVGAIDPRAAAWFRLGWEDLLSEELPYEVVVDQLPKRLTDGTRHLGLELRPIRGGERIEGILVVVTDITDRVERERADAEGQDLLAAVEHILADRASFLEFMDEAEAIVKRLLAGRAPRAEAFRNVHTLKGNAGLFGLETLAAGCHVIETRLAAGESDLSDADLEQLRSVWQTFFGRIRRILGWATDGRVELSVTEYESLLERVAAGSPRPELLSMLERLHHEPAERRLGQFAQQVARQGALLGKPPLDVVVEANGVRFDRQRFAGFWAGFVHVLRNAVDHGIETSAQERIAAGKPPNATIHLTAAEDEDGIVIEVRDDGRGVSWERVAARATEMGLPACTRADLVAALFADGLSTKDEVSALSGRGVGMGVVLQAVRALGGSLDVESEPGRGTTARFRVPHSIRAIAAR